MKKLLLTFAFVLASLRATFAASVTTVEALVAAVADAKSGAVIELAEGTYWLTQPLVLKGGITLTGAGIGKTIITSAESWKANPATLPDPETQHEKFDRAGYLIHCANDTKDITISHLTLTGPQMHGAIFGMANQGLHFHDLRLADFMYSGIRTYAMQRARIHDCTFVDAGQRCDKGQPGVKGGITGGGIFAIWMSDTEISNNRFLVTKTAPKDGSNLISAFGNVAAKGPASFHNNLVSKGSNVVNPATGMNTWQPGGAQGHSYLVLKRGAKPAVETALEDLMVAGQGRPANLTFNTAYYAQAGLAQITASGAADVTIAASQAFDRDEKTAWLDKTASGWMLRESLTEGCGRYALVQVEATGKLVFRWRDKVGSDESRVKDLGKVTLPLHLRLFRAGRRVQVFTSPDGQQWGEPLMTHTATFDGQSRLGLFVCSGNTFASTTAVFESVTVNQ